MEREGLVIGESEIRRTPGETGTASGLVQLALSFAEILRRKDGKGPLRAVIGFNAFRSSWEPQNSLLRGLSAGGVEVMHLGVVPSPVLLFAARRLGADGAILLADDGERGRKSLRLFANGSPLDREDLVLLRREMEGRSVPPVLPVRGRVRYINMIPDYLRELEKRFAGVRPLLRRFQAEVVVGANHGAASMTAPHALLRAGCRVVKLGCTLDARNGMDHAAYDSAATLQELGMVVRATRADFGASLDGEGLRAAFVDGGGRPISAGTIGALLEQPGDAEGSEEEDAAALLLRLVGALTRARTARGRKILFREMLDPPTSPSSRAPARIPSGAAGPRNTRPIKR